MKLLKIEYLISKPIHTSHMKDLYIKNLDTFMYILMGLKKYEIRKHSNFINTIHDGEIIRIHCQSFTTLCKIEEIINFSSLYDVFSNEIEHTDIIPNSTSNDNAISKYKEYYKNWHDCSFKALKLNICTI